MRKYAGRSLIFISLVLALGLAVILPFSSGAFVARLNINENAAFSVDHENLALGEIGQNGAIAYVHVRNDGNVKLNITGALEAGSGLAGNAVAEDFKPGSCEKPGLAGIGDGNSPGLLCNNLDFVDMNDEIMVRLWLNASADAPAGNYQAVFAITGNSANATLGTIEKRIAVNYSIPSKPVAKVIAPANAEPGSQSKIQVVGDNAEPIANASVEVTGEGGQSVTIITDSFGEAQFVPQANGDYTYRVLGYNTAAAETVVNASAAGAGSSNGASILVWAVGIAVLLVLLVLALYYFFVRKKNQAAES